MKLLSLGANKESFHTVHFKEGVNIIVGKQAAPRKENSEDTYNGVGKSMILHLIHFCLGSNKIPSFEKQIPDWEFTLRFENNGQQYYCRRMTSNQNSIDFSGEKLSLNKAREKLLEIGFDLKDTPANMTWTTLFSRFVRRYRSCYASFDGFVPKETPYSKLLNNCYLLGLDTELIIKKKELKDKKVATGHTEKALKTDPVFKKYYLGKTDAELEKSDLEYQIKILKEEISRFKISSNYHELELEADEKSRQKKKLENKRVLVNNYIKNIEESEAETEKITAEKVIDVYKAAQVEIPQMIRKTLDEVNSFHNELMASRNIRLKRELSRQKSELKTIDEHLAELGEEMDKLLSYLDSHGALEEYTVLTKRLSSLEDELARIETYQKMLKAYKDMKLNIKKETVEQDEDTELYLEDTKEYLDKIKNDFWKYAKQFYPKKKSGLLIRNNSKDNTVRYNVEARIEDDSSDGVNEVRIFCFDWLILNTTKSNMRFMAHDSRIFANMDPRQRKVLFKIVNEVCKDSEFQYICSVNQDTLDSVKGLMEDNEYKEMIADNIILELNDDAPESKLLGIQIDIDLEDKDKSSVDMK